MVVRNDDPLHPCPSAQSGPRLCRAGDATVSLCTIISSGPMTNTRQKNNLGDIQYAISTPQRAIASHLDILFHFEPDECKAISRRFCNRFRLHIVGARVAYFLLLSCWLYLLGVQRIFFGGWRSLVYDRGLSFDWADWVIWSIYFTLLFLTIPVVILLITNIITIRYCKKQLDEHIADGLCIMCGYSLCGACHPKGGLIICPECGQRYVHRHTDP